MTPPYIDTPSKATDIGTALAEVCNFAHDWGTRVFTSQGGTWLTGPDTLNEELQSMFSGLLTKDEQRRILARYAALRLAR